MATKEKEGLDALVSAMGSGFELVKTMAHSVKDAGGTEEDLRKLLDYRGGGHIRYFTAQLLIGKDPLAVLDVRELDFWVDPGDGDIERLIREGPFGRRKIKMPLDAVKFKESFGPARVKIAEFLLETHGPLGRQVRDLARKQKKKIASVQHLLAFAAKYPSVAKQVSLCFPHDSVYIHIYDSDITLRWQPGGGGWPLGSIVRCLVMAD